MTIEMRIDIIYANIEIRFKQNNICCVKDFVPNFVLEIFLIINI